MRTKRYELLPEETTTVIKNTVLEYYSTTNSAESSQLDALVSEFILIVPNLMDEPLRVGKTNARPVATKLALLMKAVYEGVPTRYWPTARTKVFSSLIFKQIYSIVSMKEKADADRRAAKAPKRQRKNKDGQQLPKNNRQRRPKQHDESAAGRT